MASAAASASGSQQCQTAAPVWHACQHCPATPTFRSTADFVRHLQEKHCTRLDAAGLPTTSRTSRYICRFGPGAVCSVATAAAAASRLHGGEIASVDLNEDDTFEQHALRHHLSPILPNANHQPPTPTTDPNSAASTSASRKHSTVSQRSVASACSASGSIASATLPDWTIFSSSQNLPAVLNDPSRGKQTYFFTKKWGDSFVDRPSIAASPLLLPEVTHADLDAYMQRIIKRHRRHQRMAAMSAELPAVAEMAAPAVAGQQISDIPAVFLQPNLQLSDPAIFALAFPGLEAALPTGLSGVADRPEAAAARLNLQERLSHYLDVVEVHITRKVSQQSGAFFAAMTSQHTIMSEMHAAMLNVRQLRQQLRRTDATLVRDGMRACGLARRQHNQERVLAKLHCMAEVHKTQPMLQLLLGTADYVAAIDLIASTQALLQKELRDVVCVKHLPSQLVEMERLIDKMLRTEFERFATADLNRRQAEEGDEDTPEAELNVQVADEERLVSIVWGLLRQRNFGFVETYRDEAIVTVRALIKELLIERLASGDADTCVTGAGEESQSLSIGEWIELLERATVRLLRLLRRVRAVIAVMERVAAQSAGEPLLNADDSLDEADAEYFRSGAFLTRSEKETVLGRLSSLMAEVCQYCHERCATLISSQSLERGVATAGQVERLQRVVGAFCAGCERLTEKEARRTACVPLLAALKAQATRFAQRFHAERKAKLALLLDAERWRAAEVPAELQRLVERIGGGRWTQGAGEKAANHDNSVDQNGSTSAPALLVDGEPFVLVGAALLLLQIVDEYARCAVRLRVCAAQLARHVVDLLRTFNSRCCQLVLGAGALRVAGLKTITSGMLALVARALQLVVWMLPHIRGHFQRAADPMAGVPEMAEEMATSQAKEPVVQVNGNGVHHHGSQSSGGGGYDIVERDLLGHIAEIETMILSIVTQLVTSQMDGWTARPPVPSPAFRSISRHFVKLHEAIGPIMPEVQVRRIYGVVHRTFKDKLREQLVRRQVVNNGGPAHGVVTAELTFYAETVRQLGVLDGRRGDEDVDELSDERMADVWRK